MIIQDIEESDNYQHDDGDIRNKAKDITGTHRSEQADIELMAHLVFAENGDDSYSEYKKAMMYTGSVVLNRVASDKFPGTIEDVIYQKGQYACTWDGGMDKKPSEDAYEVAEDLIRNGSKIPDKVLYAAEFKQGCVYDYVAGTYYCY